MPRAAVCLIAYVVAAFAVGWIGYWWFVGFMMLSPLIATTVAFRNDEYWPVVHPRYVFFWFLPVALVSLQLFMHHPREWAQWLAWSAALAAVIVTAWTVKYRRQIDREWAVFGTLAAVFVLSAFGLNVLNENAGGQTRSAELAAIVGASPGGYRQGPPRLTVETSAYGRQAFFVGWASYSPLQDGRAVCVQTFSGALTWRWTTLAACTEDEIEQALAD